MLVRSGEGGESIRPLIFRFTASRKVLRLRSWNPYEPAEVDFSKFKAFKSTIVKFSNLIRKKQSSVL